MKPEDIAMSHHPEACGYYSIINLFKLRGFDPPKFADLAASFLSLLKRDEPKAGRRAGFTVYSGMTAFDELGLIEQFGFPYLCAVSVIPRREPPVPPESVLKPLLLAGADLILGYYFRQPTGQRTLHSVVCDGYTAEGYKVIDSAGGYAEGSVIEFEPNYTPEYLYEWQCRKERQTHGANRILPFAPVRQGSGLGLDPYFMIVYR